MADGTCPNPKCNATISGSADVVRVSIGSKTSGQNRTAFYAVACKYCTHILGTVSATR